MQVEDDHVPRGGADLDPRLEGAMCGDPLCGAVANVTAEVLEIVIALLGVAAVLAVVAELMNTGVVLQEDDGIIGVLLGRGYDATHMLTRQSAKVLTQDHVDGRRALKRSDDIDSCRPG